MYIAIGSEYLWALFLPFIVYVQKPGEYSYRYLWIVVICLVLHLFLDTKGMLFFAIAFSIFFFIESSIGKLNKISPLLIILIAPFTRYFIDLFGFPIRLQLSSLSSRVIQLFGFESYNTGNTIFVNGQAFSVDPACMGLKLVVTALVIALFMISFYERKKRFQVPIVKTMVILALGLAFTIIANLVRIVFLVLTEAPEGGILHEAIGLMCLILFIIAPLYFTIPRFIKSGKLFTEQQLFNSASNWRFVTYVLIISIVAYHSQQYQAGDDIPPDPYISSIELPGYDKKVLANHIVQFQNMESTVFIKPNKGFYRSDHNPMICWKGSGFFIREERLMELGDQTIYIAKLDNGQEILHTAWWYDNGTERTTSQLSWRFRQMKGAAPFKLVNVTSSSMDRLMVEASYLLTSLDLTN